MKTLKFKLTIAYDGTRYDGWQIQKTGIGIQEKIEEALQKVFQESIRLHGASRTDAGVHARGMVAHFELPAEKFKMPVRKLPLALNAHLPSDIRIMGATRCSPEFHARFSATGKQYRYFIWNYPYLDPLIRHYCWHIPRKLNAAEMKKATGYFIGTHDFKSFAANRNYEVENTIRTIWRCELKRSGHLYTFIIEGDGFLYKMCRGIVGTIAQVGLGKISINQIPEIFEMRDRKAAGMSAPPQGLVLWKVYYDKKHSPTQVPVKTNLES